MSGSASWAAVKLVCITTDLLACGPGLSTPRGSKLCLDARLQRGERRRLPARTPAPLSRKGFRRRRPGWRGRRRFSDGRAPPPRRRPVRPPRRRGSARPGRRPSRRSLRRWQVAARIACSDARGDGSASGKAARRAALLRQQRRTSPTSSQNAAESRPSSRAPRAKQVFDRLGAKRDRRRGTLQPQRGDAPVLAAAPRRRTRAQLPADARRRRLRAAS